MRTKLAVGTVVTNSKDIGPLYSKRIEHPKGTRRGVVVDGKIPFSSHNVLVLWSDDTTPRLCNEKCLKKPSDK